MKKILSSLLLVLISIAGFSQGTSGINYQAVARNLNGTVLDNQPILVRFSITQGSGGTLQYRETQNTTTNAYGLFNLVIGKGTPVSGTFASIPWAAANQWLEVEVAVGGGALNSLGKVPFYAVPFAVNAATANPVGAAGGDLTGTYPNPVLSNSTVAPGAYGNAANYPTFTVDGKGRLTLAGQLPLPGATGPAGGDLTGAYPNPTLANTSVTAGTYGNASNYPTFTVDSKGRLTLAGQLPIPGPGGPAGGDLSGTYPNPTINIPLIKTSAQTANPLISLTNSAGTGTLGAFQASSASTDASAVAIQGTISSTSPGGFSSALRGVNNGTGGLGIGVWGSQAGSGWGVYGTAASGIGVNGSGGTGIGVNGTAGSGTGVNGSSSTGNAGNFTISNAANANSSLIASTVGDGAAMEGTSSSTNASVAAVRGIISSTSPGGFSAAVRGVNNGTGGLGIGVWGSQAGSGWGLYGTAVSGIGVNGNGGTGIGVNGSAGSGIGVNGSSSTGIAGSFVISNAANTSNALEASSVGTGAAVRGSNTAATGSTTGVIGLTASNANGIGAQGGVSGVVGQVTPTAPGGYSAGVRGLNNGTGGTGIGVIGYQAGSGWGVYGETPSGFGVYGLTTNGTAVSSGVRGETFSTNGVGVQARYSGSGVGIALEVGNGGIRVSGVNKAAFIHTATPANKLSANGTDVDNPMCNNDPNCILIITQKLNPVGIVYNNSPMGVYYNSIRGKWEIFNENNVAIPDNAQFNVLVIKQ